MKFKGSHILSTSQFTRRNLKKLFNLAERMHRISTREVRCEVLTGYKLLELFFEASTRTLISHATAFERLGGSVNSVQNVEFSSMSKGETFEDTIRVMAAMCDALVIRTREKGQVVKAAKVVDRARDLAKKPIIFNAGDGAGEHPTQGLLDVYSIKREKGRIKGLTIALCGDLKHSRTVHSLVRLLALYKNVRLKLVSPKSLSLPKKLVRFLKKKKVRFSATDDFDKGIRRADVLYMIRVQKERFENEKEYKKHRAAFVLTKKKVKRLCKKSVTILHPLPRTVEIHPSVDELPNAAYFRQSDRGIELRMALFLLTLDKKRKFV